MNLVKLMMGLIFGCISIFLIFLALFIFNLNTAKEDNINKLSFPLIWEFIMSHPMYSLGIIMPAIGMIIGTVKIFMMDDDRFAKLPF